MSKFLHIHTDSIIKSISNSYEDSTSLKKDKLIKGEVLFSNIKEDIGKVFEYNLENLKKLKTGEFKKIMKSHKNENEEELNL